ncbi:MAG: succinate dehydrogenase cytochrome b subunit [Acidobacteriaceae bacterium]
MSATAVNLTQRAPNFWQSANGKKIVMAVTGFILFLFILGHLLGNLLVFAGPERFNSYAAILHFDMTLLWIVRSILILAVVLHIIAAVQLAVRNKKARPVGYARKKSINSTYAARTMYWSGPIILAFVIFHLLQFTSGTIHPGSVFIPGDVYHNVTAGFQVWWVSAWYIFALILLGLHLRHGLWSMLQSFGMPHSLRRERVLKEWALVISVLVIIGYITIPISVLTGLIK